MLHFICSNENEFQPVQKQYASPVQSGTKIDTPVGERYVVTVECKGSPDGIVFIVTVTSGVIDASNDS